jgi:homoserine kinase
MALYLEIEAEAAAGFTIEATGRDATLVGAPDANLLLETYRAVGPDAPPLHLRIRNGIPLGMGCGSSAAALLAGVMLADHFGALEMGPEAILAEACRREGHPDNVAACFRGGFTVSGMHAGVVATATFGVSSPWRLLLALPAKALATSEARALLPDTYSRGEVVGNIQATALLVAAFALGRADLLAAGTRDWMHQPYRGRACPLLPALLPLAGRDGVHAVTLSGAGPSVLLIVDKDADATRIAGAMRDAVKDPGLEIVETGVAAGAVVL